MKRRHQWTQSITNYHCQVCPACKAIRYPVYSGRGKRIGWRPAEDENTSEKVGAYCDGNQRIGRK